MNILEIIVLVIAAILAISGFRSGFVKKLTSMLSLLIAVALVSAVLPYVTDFLKENTPVYTYIEGQVDELVSQYATDLYGFDVSATQSAVMDMSREEIKDLLNEYGYGSYASMVDQLSDEELAEYEEYYFSEILGDSSNLISGEDQSAIIDELPLPDIIKNLMRNTIGENGLDTLNVTDFMYDIVEFLSSLILDVLSFVVAFILVEILLRAAIAVLNAIAHFPVISLVNRLAGFALGLLEALFFLWLFFLLLMVLQATGIGTTLIAMVEQSTILNWLYQTNLFWRIFTAIM